MKANWENDTAKDFAIFSPERSIEAVVRVSTHVAFDAVARKRSCQGSWCSTTSCGWYDVEKPGREIPRLCCRASKRAAWTSCGWIQFVRRNEFIVQHVACGTNCVQLAALVMHEERVLDADAFDPGASLTRKGH